MYKYKNTSLLLKMNPQRRYIFQETRYPKIFIKCRSFGNHCLHADRPYPNDIINNRNQFIEDYRIKCYYSRIPKYATMRSGMNEYGGDCSLFDHQEPYKTIDNKYVIVISTYDRREKSREKLIENGWTPYNNMYGNGAETFVFVTDMRR